ncbi:MAG TPA: indolepyruvate ferredoxin oxidoreductase subunit alpha [Syntrophorhabdaceae bacterium]|nr:indolepyruvate ferredoxin oxidoreductase subunit alpha [Syntrophorhabdaceae bacterium]HPC66932.1 indolepyruvate ferredoxin oxidoreductase subunit alpha [Syntrophorhabdaceae bacterium]HRR71538.1 indolepyruvate ferredoxin oxidoreductase subunit alpha [Syntrophorhabdaceae bacterium]HRV22614.1 indolepyruvate ferredoxin oxidoreductase subunit alpha [Syntrophorhabdaceae bacterium]
MKKEIMQGNAAIARGAWEAGLKVAAAYPGTPSSEILREFAENYPDIYAEWAPNEKVAVEVASGAAIAGVRAMASMKHVGLNVAADPLMTLSYTGIKGGFVIVVADDPNVHSSQNEQDSRNWARFGKVPMLEPGDAQECKDFTKIAFEISEQFDTPVLLRTETRVAHSDSPVVLEDRVESKVVPGLDPKEAPKYVMVPVNVRVRRKAVEEKMKKLSEYADTFKYNIMEINDTSVGVISSGVSYLYTKEVFPEWSYLKLGMVWPLPKKLIAEFAKKVKKIVIVEELDPFFETEIRAMGIKIWHGKDVIPNMYELSPEIVEKALKGKKYKEPKIRVKPEDLPRRPPNLCAGCSHRPLFYALKKLGAFVFGDIGCYTLATAPPLQALHTTICMGAGVGQAHGAMKALGKDWLGKVVAVLGDSTFLHSGVTPLMDVVYNKGNSTTIILDNRITGMTGHQEHAGTGFTARQEPTNMVDYAELGKALGVKSIRYVDPYNIKETMDIIKEEMNKDEPSLIICKDSPCMLLRRAKPLERFKYPFYVVDTDKCRGCKMCLEINCPAISWREGEGQTKDGHKRKGTAFINKDQCVGCEVCAQVCKFDAIVPGTK